MRASLILLSLPAWCTALQLGHCVRLAHAPTGTPRVLSVPVMAAADDLKKLQAALIGLRDDGVPPEALAPLEAQIAECEAIVAAEQTASPVVPPVAAPAADAPQTEAAAQLEKLRVALYRLKEDGLPPEALAPLEAQIVECETAVAAEQGAPSAVAVPPVAAPAAAAPQTEAAAPLPAAPPAPAGPPTAAAAELAKLLTTYAGLKQDGFPPEALEPLEAKIVECEAKVTAEAALLATLPPMTPAQRQVYDMCDKIEKEMTRSDEDAPKRLAVLRGERIFLMTNLLRADAAAYVALLPVLFDRGLAMDDFPFIDGMAMVSPEAVMTGVAAADAADATKAARAATAAEAEAQREAALAADEADREAAAAAGDGSVDGLFAKCFLTSEEIRLSIAPNIVGVKMWSPVQEQLRMKSVSAFLDQLNEGTPIDDALIKLGREDRLRQALKSEVDKAGTAAAINAARIKAGTEPTGNVVMPTVAERFEAAWSDRAKFVAMWKGRIPDAPLDDVLANTDGLSAVGKMRVEGAASDSMSKRSDNDPDPTKKLNKLFSDWVDKNSK